MKLTGTEILALYNTLSSLEVSGTPKFAYAMAKNHKVLGDFVQKLDEERDAYIKGNARIAEYQKAVQNLIQKYAVDAAGKPALRPAPNGMMQRVVPQEKMQEFSQARQVIDEEYNDVIVGMDVFQQSMEASIREEVEIDLHIVRLEDFPANIPQSSMNHLFVLVDDAVESTGPRLVK